MQTGTNIDVEKYLNDCINEYKDDENGNGLFLHNMVKYKKRYL